MKEENIKQPAILPDPYVDGDPEYLDSRPLLSGLNLVSVIDELNKFKSAHE